MLRVLATGRAPFQYPIRRLNVRYREVSKPRDLYVELSDRSEIWQAHRQHCCRCACQISKYIVMRSFKLYQSISRLRDFTRSYGKTSYQTLKRCPDISRRRRRAHRRYQQFAYNYSAEDLRVIDIMTRFGYSMITTRKDIQTKLLFRHFGKY